jgi:hypothetical protein
MENLNNQLNVEEVLINSDINNIDNENKVDKIIAESDIERVTKQRKIDSILLDKDEAKDNLKKFLARREERLNGENNKVYNSAA